MMNGYLQGLYEAAKSDRINENGIPEMDRQKLKKFLDSSTLGSRNKDVYMRKESKFYTCPMYDPCPICDKCRNKASHLYVRCQTCQIYICVHTYNDRDKMIKRHNFIEFVSEETMDLIKQLDKKICAA